MYKSNCAAGIGRPARQQRVSQGYRSVGLRPQGHATGGSLPPTHLQLLAIADEVHLDLVANEALRHQPLQQAGQWVVSSETQGVSFGV